MKQNKKHIWYISKYAGKPNHPGPVRQYLFTKQFARKGYPSILVSSNSNGFDFEPFKGLYKEEKIENNFSHITLNGPKINLGFSLKRIWSWIIFEFNLLRYFFKNRPKKNDIIIVSSLSIFTFLTGVLLKKLFKVKLILEVRDIWPLTLQEVKKISSKNPFIWLLGLIEKTGYKNADYIVGSMPNLKEHVQNVTPGHEQKVRYIPMGFDPEIFHHPKENKTRKNKDKFIACYAGSIGNVNRVELILQAAERLQEYPDIEFYILGDGPHKKRFQEEFKHLNNVKFFDPIPKKEVVAFLQQCDILLNPFAKLKLYDYGISPNKWIDYMYAGKPIIVPFDGYRHMIDECGCGEFIKADDPDVLAKTILKYARMPEEKRLEMGRKGQEYLWKNLTYEKLAEKYIALFEDES